MSSRIFNLQNYSKGFILYKLLENSKPVYLIKKRIQSKVTDLKTQFYITDTQHQYISSIYPSNLNNDFKGLFSLSNGNYKFDYKGLKYTLKIDNNNALISKAG